MISLPMTMLILRRVQLADGRTRAFINDQPVSVQVLQSLGAALVEIHGQHDERALVDASTHRRLLDAFGGLDSEAARSLTLRRRALAEQAIRPSIRAGIERALRGRLAAPRRRRIAEARARGGRGNRARRGATIMMQAEKVAEDLRDAHDAAAGHEAPGAAIGCAVHAARAARDARHRV